MTGIIVLAVLALALVAALEVSNRRNAQDPRPGLSGGWGTEDRDVARTKFDLLALTGRTAPFTRKPFGISEPDNPFTTRRARHFSWNHGRHAA